VQLTASSPLLRGNIWQGSRGSRAAFGLFSNDTDSVSEDPPQFCLQLRKVQMDKKVDLDLVTSWMQWCDTTHDYSSEPLKYTSAVKDVRFIDIKNRCIVKQDGPVRYAALSYTWGTRRQYCLYKENADFLQLVGSLDHDDVSLRKGVVDAVEVCAKAGVPYLWVDALCIIQDDTEGKMAQIQNMDSIYLEHLHRHHSGRGENGTRPRR
jgi:hypothetical protein